jgi:glycosyltransferase involved in cell wall biosynthesis
MRILIVTVFFPPINSIASLRPYSWAKQWAENGCDVTVLTVPNDQTLSSSLTLPNQSFRILHVPSKWDRWFGSVKDSLRHASPSDSKKSKTSFIQKLKSKIVEWAIAYKKRKGFFNACRMPDKTHFWIKPALKEISQEQPWDLVVSTSGPYTTHLIAYELKKSQAAARWIADFRDPWSDNKLFPGIFPFRLIEKRLEKKLMREADVITTVSPQLRTELGKRHGDQKTHTIENGIDFEDFKRLDPTPIFPDDGTFRIVHTGTIYDGRNNPLPLLQALKALGERARHVEVLFCGVNGADLPKQVHELDLDHCVSLIPLVKREDALRMQRDADALLFLPWGDVEKNGIISGKIFEYFYSENPVIAVGGTAEKGSIHILDDLVIKHAFGNDVDKIKAYLLEQIDRQPAQEKISYRSSLQKYSRKALADKMLQLSKAFDQNTN